MSGLGFLLYAGLKAVGHVVTAIDNERSKQSTRKIDGNGNVVSYGRTGQQYINNEKTYNWTEKDKYGNTHNLTIGLNSGRVYRDSYDDKVKEIFEECETKKIWALENNKASYDMFDTRFWDYIKIETSTGKRISCLYKGINPETHKKEYRKFYWDETLFKKYGRQAINKTQDGDMGIVISENDYYNLHYSGIYSKYSALPTDPKVLNKLWGYDCF